MKNKFYILLFGILLGCKEEPTKQTILTKVKDNNNIKYEILRIDDGCQYIHFYSFSNPQNSWGGHYSLCDNPIHTFR